MPIWWIMLFMGIITILSFIVLYGHYDNDEMIRHLMKMDLKQHHTFAGLFLSAIGFLILGVALWTIHK